MARAARGIGEKATSYSSSIKDLQNKLALANLEELEAFERSLASDTRKGVQAALRSARRRIEKEQAEASRLNGLYQFEQQLAQEHHAHCYCGLDEVGRGSVAGPLAVGAVILPHDYLIQGLNDSKQITPQHREVIAEDIKQHALAWTVQYVSADIIDAKGMTAALRMAFRLAVDALEEQGFELDLLLLDGNPLHFDKRECTIVKGDAQCASIAAASIVAKVDRDALMEQLALKYPEYGFESCKGYASEAHIEAIKKHGLSPVHRESFCTSFLQRSLFDDFE